MRNLTASGTAPQVLWNDTTASATDFRMVANVDKLRLQDDSTTSWVDQFDWSSEANVSYQSVVVSEGTPTLTFEDTTPSDLQFRVRSSSDVLQAQAYDTTVSPETWSSFMEIGGDYVYAPGGAAAGHAVGSPGQDHVVGIKHFTFELPADSPSGQHTIDLYEGSPPDVAGQTVGVLVLLTTDTSPPYTYDAFDAKESAADGFYVEVTRSSSGDTATIHYDTTTYPEGSTSGVLLHFYDLC